MTLLEKLKELEAKLKSALDACTDERVLAQLARQYRETIKEIEEIEGVTGDNDEIDELMGKRRTEGKSGAVR